jgi:chromosome segregation ATPase
MGDYIEKMSSAMKTTKTTKKNNKPGIFGNIFGKTLKRLGWRKKKEDSPNTKIIKELEKIKPPTTNVASEIKEQNELISRLRKNIQKDAKNIEKEKKNIKILNKVSQDVNALKLQKEEEIKELRHKAKLKTEKEKARILHGLNIPITTEQTDLKKMSELPPVPTYNPKTYDLENDLENDLEKELGDISIKNKLGDIPIAYIQHYSVKKRSKGGKKHGKSKKNKTYV